MLPPVTQTEAWVESGTATDWAAVEAGRHPTDVAVVGIGESWSPAAGGPVVSAARTLTWVLGWAVCGVLPPFSRRLCYLGLAPSGWRVVVWGWLCLACQAASYLLGESPSSPAWIRWGLYHPSM